MATIGVAGRHRSLRLPRTSAHADPRAGVRRAWLAPLLALLAIGLLPVLGRSLVWLGTAATDAPASDTTTTAPASTPAPTAMPTPSATPPAVAFTPPAAASSSAADASSSPRRATKARGPAPSSVATVPPAAVVVPPAQDPDPASVQQPVDTPPQDTGTSDKSAPETNTSTDPGPDGQPPETPACCDPVLAGG